MSQWTDFPGWFRALWGHAPFPWQCMLAERLAAHDSLILLDETHLSVLFMQTLRAVERYRGEDWAEQPIRARRFGRAGVL